ncbi:hypothetical protein [Kitasatospora sp. NBC_01302]|uniref:hypothetical protein n=1 Tax=Kitasatospora sp. NBC_01302 TaxID=2903575 RepID=UPI002E0E222F|nr:hypothetical protein OG294_00430 [Kitasatospora sp. NBC_01302]
MPAETGVPLSRWTCPELAAELTARGITDTASASTVRRWLREDALKPRQYRSWFGNGTAAGEECWWMGRARPVAET